MQQCFRHLGWAKGDLPQTELAAEETLALPIFPELQDAEQRTVVGRIAEFFNVPRCRDDHRDRAGQQPATLDAPHFLRRMNAVGRADDVRC
jgi:hypothetical protein